MAGYSDAAAFWDGKYDGPGYRFGTAPNAFLAREAGRLAPNSRVLAVADGEGRNGVWLAEQGHQVTAFDISPKAVAKARALADSRGVSLYLNCWDLESFPLPEATYDAVAAIFIQFLQRDPSGLNQSARGLALNLIKNRARSRRSNNDADSEPTTRSRIRSALALAPGEREAFFKRLIATLKPGGLLFLQGYRPEQVDYGTGGPPNRDQMYTQAWLHDQFAGLTWHHVASYDADIREGTGHAGLSALIELVAEKSG